MYLDNPAVPVTSRIVLENPQKLGASRNGERAGIRTLDLLIKSQLLYRLSYALPVRVFKAPAEVGGTYAGDLAGSTRKIALSRAKMHDCRSERKGDWQAVRSGVRKGGNSP